MKKIITSICILILCTSTCLAQGSYYQEYLQNKKHFTLFNSFVEKRIEKIIEKNIRKNISDDVEVNLKGYNISSMRNGYFKDFEITARDITSNKIPISYLHLKSLSDFNQIDYKQKPIKIKTETEFLCELELTENSINKALTNEKYNETINKLNSMAFPLFKICNVSTKIVKNKFYILTEYNFPIALKSKNRVFVIESDFTVEDGIFKPTNVNINSAYGDISLEKVTNLVNILDPLNFTLKLMDSQKFYNNIENVKIVDNKLIINGKIKVKGD